jgi:hypothetical protein
MVVTRERHMTWSRMTSSPAQSEVAVRSPASASKKTPRME